MNADDENDELELELDPEVTVHDLEPGEVLEDDADRVTEDER